MIIPATLSSPKRVPRRSATRAAAFALLAVLVAAGAASAQSAAVVDPPSVVLRGEPGETVAGSVRWTNLGDAPLPLRLYLSDWHFDEVGNFTFHDVGSQPRSASAHLDFSPSALELPPNQSVVVRYELAVPADTSPGTHWTVLFAESEPPDPVPGAPSAAISVRVGHIVYLQVHPLQSAGAIAGIFGDPPRSSSDAYRLYVHYLNTGNAAQGVSGTLSVRNDRGEAVIEADIERQVVLPESDRVMQFDLVGPLPAGNYTALVVLDYGDPDVEVAGTHDFTLTADLAAPGGD